MLGVVDVTEASHEPEALVGQPEALLEGTVAGSEDLVSGIKDHPATVLAFSISISMNIARDT